MDSMAVRSGDESYNISWAVYPDDGGIELDDYKQIKIIATPGAARHIDVDYIANGNSDLDIILKREEVVYYKPLYLFVHSGVRLSLSDFGDKWDSGQCGFAAITKADAEYWGLKEEDYEGFLAGAVKVLDLIYAGNVFGYTIKRKVMCDSCKQVHEDVLDSCWGFVTESVDKFVEEEVMPTVRQVVADFQEREDNLCRG